MTAESKIKSIAAGVTVTLFATLVGTGILYRDNSLLSENIQAEKVRTERLEAERSALKSEMDKLSNDLSTYKVKNSELDLIFREAQQKLELQQARVAQLTKEKAGLEQLKKENASIRKIRQDLVSQLEKMQADNGQLQTEITELNRTIAQLRNENSNLYARINTKSIMAYNFRTEVVKRRNERLTVKAKRTHHINISFDVNQAAALPGNFHVKLQSPANKEISGELQITANSLMQKEMLTASLEQGWLPAQEYRSISLTFDPAEKLTAGIYHLMVYAGNDYLGSTQFRLAK